MKHVGKIVVVRKRLGEGGVGSNRRGGGPAAPCARERVLRAILILVLVLGCSNGVFVGDFGRNGCGNSNGNENAAIGVDVS